MPRRYEDLLSNDPAWPELAKAVTASPNRAVALAPPDNAARRACIEPLQVTTRSMLGALAHETGGVLVDDGWLRILGAGSRELPRVLGGYNADLGVPLSTCLIVADDVVGGVFAINSGGLGDAVGQVYYFAPDTLEWEGTDLGHTDFMGWALQGDLAKYYAEQRWSGWREEVAKLAGDMAIHVHPPLWTQEGKRVGESSRRPVAAKELWLLQQKFCEAMAG